MPSINIWVLAGAGKRRSPSPVKFLRLRTRFSSQGADRHTLLSEEVGLRPFTAVGGGEDDPECGVTHMASTYLKFFHVPLRIEPGCPRDRCLRLKNSRFHGSIEEIAFDSRSTIALARWRYMTSCPMTTTFIRTFTIVSCHTRWL